MSTTVTIPLEEFDALRKRANEREDEIEKLKKEIVNARLDGLGSQVRSALQSVRPGSRIVGFAMANLSPREIKGWPTEDLVLFSRGLDSLPDATPQEVEFAHEMRAFAGEADRWVAHRKAVGERYIPEPGEAKSLEDIPLRSRPQGEPPSLSELERSKPGDEGDENHKDDKQPKGTKK